MAKINSKRQITLPTKQCDEAGIKPGDDVETMIVDGWLVIRKKGGKNSTMEQSLEGFPAELDEEDQQWLNDKPVGKEIL